MEKVKQEEGGGVPLFCRSFLVPQVNLLEGYFGYFGSNFLVPKVNWLVPPLTGCLHETVGCP
ncbi:hypothetical protein Syun_020535 [Stephania yunnanensis]|uniref:Uncharacterized protein n=1 Tax=Stephania yunnanensis TaxID=152371 RepID=A0AAP0NNZ4_9MAGN